MTIENILISHRAVSSQYKEGEFFKYLPRIFSYLLSKHDDDGFSGCENVRLAVTDSFDRDTRTVLSEESVVIFDLSVAHGCDEIIKAFGAKDTKDLCTFNDFILDVVEKHLHESEDFQRALWLHMCRRSLFFDYKHHHRLKSLPLPPIPEPDDWYWVEIKLKAIVLAHEIRHHLISTDSRAHRINRMLDIWIGFVQYESFADLDEKEFLELLENSVEELVCDYAAISYVDDFDWDLQIKSKTPQIDFSIAMFSLALLFDLQAHLKYGQTELEHKSLQLRSAILRRSSYAVAGGDRYDLLVSKYEALRSHALSVVNGVLHIRNFTPSEEITEFARADFALEYFNGYDRENSDEWDAFMEKDMEAWYRKVHEHLNSSGDLEFSLIDRICRDAMSGPWLAPTVELLFERGSTGES